MRVTTERFRALVAQAIDRLPPEFAERLDNVDVVVEDYPDEETQARFPGGFLLGLYHGVPLTGRSIMVTRMPDIIYIYKRNIERICRSEAEIRTQVRDTLLHEIGHHFGLDEEELRDI
jgi:predicted Zn-dependent protease with MMP-like domain